MVGEIGAAGPFGNDEAAGLNDELQTVGAGHGIPTDPNVAVLDAFDGSGPTEDGHELVAAVFRLLSVNALPENMSCRTAGFEVVLVTEDRSELAEGFYFRSRSARPSVPFRSSA